MSRPLVLVSILLALGAVVVLDQSGADREPQTQAAGLDEIGHGKATGGRAAELRSGELERRLRAQVEAAAEFEGPAESGPATAGRWTRGAAAEGVIAGRVCLPDGAPAEGALVTLTRDELWVAPEDLSTVQRIRLKQSRTGHALDYSGPEGSFEFTELLAGSYSIEVGDGTLRAGAQDLAELRAAGAAKHQGLVPGDPPRELVFQARQLQFRLHPLHGDWGVTPRLRVVDWKGRGGEGGLSRPLLSKLFSPLEVTPGGTGLPRVGGALTERHFIPVDLTGAEVELTDAAGRGLLTDVAWVPGDYRPLIDVHQNQGSVLLVVNFSAEHGEFSSPNIHVASSPRGDGRELSRMRPFEGPSRIEAWVPAGPLSVRAWAWGAASEPPISGKPALGDYPAQEFEITGRAAERIELDVVFRQGGWVRLGGGSSAWLDWQQRPSLRARDTGGEPGAEHGLTPEEFVPGPDRIEIVLVSEALLPGEYEVAVGDDSAVPVTVRPGEVAELMLADLR